MEARKHRSAGAFCGKPKAVREAGRRAFDPAPSGRNPPPAERNRAETLAQIAEELKKLAEGGGIRWRWALEGAGRERPDDQAEAGG